MAKGNVEFKHRLTKAIEILRKKLSLKECDAVMLRTPRRDGSRYVWSNLMGSDGVLAGHFEVEKGDRIAKRKCREFWAGVLIQSEFSTSDGIPNPYGKAAAPLAPNGVWADMKQHGRVRLDHVHVLLVVPRSSAPQDATRNRTAQANVMKAAEAFRDCVQMVVPKGNRAHALADLLEPKVKKLLGLP